MAAQFTEANFKKEVLESAVPVVVDFWAPWCSPCKAVAPVFESVAAELNGRVKLGKVNIDDNPAIASQFGIMSIPTFVFIKNGTVMGQLSGGSLSKDGLKNKIEEVFT